MPLPVASHASTCLVTGASSGIGAAIARELARRGRGVTLVARREDRLRELAAALAGEWEVRAEVVAADVGDAGERERLADEVERRGLVVDVLVNNAGFGTGGRFQELDPAREEEMVRVNVVALHALCAHYAPEMVARGRGAIMNMASTAAFQPLPRQATYGATKTFVLDFTQALGADLHGTGVTATAVCPGVTRTPFYEVGDLEELSATMPEFALMDADTVARHAVDGLADGRPVVVPGAFNKVSAASGQFTPRRIIVPMMRRVYPVGR